MGTDFSSGNPFTFLFPDKANGARPKTEITLSSVFCVVKKNLPDELKKLCVFLSLRASANQDSSITEIRCGFLCLFFLSIGFSNGFLCLPPPIFELSSSYFHDQLLRLQGSPLSAICCFFYLQTRTVTATPYHVWLAVCFSAFSRETAWKLSFSSPFCFISRPSPLPSSVFQFFFSLILLCLLSHVTP